MACMASLSGPRPPPHISLLNRNVSTRSDGSPTGPMTQAGQAFGANACDSATPRNAAGVSFDTA